MNAAREKHAWTFAPRFRRGAFGWKSEPAITRIKEALAEIKAVAKKDPLLGAEGAVTFLRKLSPALENIDGSSGAIGSAVNRAIDALVPIIASAPAEQPLRRKWLEALFEAIQDDQIADHWGELCATPEIAREWAERLVPHLESMWRRGDGQFGYFSGTDAGFSALLAAGEFDRLHELLAQCPHPYWSYRRWGVKALVAQGKPNEALALAEANHGRNDPTGEIAETCEAILLSMGRNEEAYRRYALIANRASTYLATFRAILKKYPDKSPETVLTDLARSTPGNEGKWFAAAKDAKLFDLALSLARQSPVDHRTLIRAADDFKESQARFSLQCGLIALYWICAGRSYDVTNAEVLSAYELSLVAADNANCRDNVMAEIRRVLDSFPNERLARGLLASRLETPSAQ